MEFELLCYSEHLSMSADVFYSSFLPSWRRHLPTCCSKEGSNHKAQCMRFLKLFRAFKPRKTKQRDSRGHIHTIVWSFLSLAFKQMERVLLKTVELSSRVTKKVESFWSNLNLFSSVVHVSGCWNRNSVQHGQKSTQYVFQYSQNYVENDLCIWSLDFLFVVQSNSSCIKTAWRFLRQSSLKRKYIIWKSIILIPET